MKVNHRAVSLPARGASMRARHRLSPRVDLLESRALLTVYFSAVNPEAVTGSATIQGSTVISASGLPIDKQGYANEGSSRIGASLQGNGTPLFSSTMALSALHATGSTAISADHLQLKGDPTSGGIPGRAVTLVARLGVYADAGSGGPGYAGSSATFKADASINGLAFPSVDKTIVSGLDTYQSYTYVIFKSHIGDTLDVALNASSSLATASATTSGVAYGMTYLGITLDFSDFYYDMSASALSLSDGNVDFAYNVTGPEVLADEYKDFSLPDTSPTFPNTTIKFYWQKPENIGASFGDLAYTYNVDSDGKKALGDHSFQFNIGSPPPGAIFLLAVADAENVFTNPADAGLYNSVWGGLDKRAQVTLPTSTGIQNVTAQYDHGGHDGASFGSYLVGVPLSNKFTITTQDASHSIAEVDYQFNNGSASVSGKARRAGSTNDWTFTQDVGALAGDVTKLTITIRDGSGASLDSDDYGVDMQDSLDFHLREDVPGGSPEGTEVGGLRFIRGISVPGQLTGTFADLPDYYDFAFTRLQIGATSYPITVAATDDVGGEFVVNMGTGQGQLDTALLASGTTRVTPLVLTKSGPGGIRESFGHANLTTIDLPSWMGESDKITRSYDAATGSFVLVIPYPPLTAQNSPILTSGFADTFSIFNGLENSLNLGLHLKVVAPLAIDAAAPKLTAEDWSAKAVILDQTVLDEGDALDFDSITVDADLAPTSLNVSSITIRTDEISFEEDDTTLFDLKFPSDGGTYKKSFSIPVGTLPLGIKGSLDLKGELKGTLTRLAASAVLVINVSDAGARFDATRSYFQIDAGAHVDLTATADASVGLGITVLPAFDKPLIPLVTFAAEGKIWADVNGTFRVDIGGSLLSPSITFDTAHSSATLKAGYNLKYDYAFFTNDVKIDPKDPKKTVSDSYEKTLFGPAKPDQPKFTPPVVTLGPDAGESPGLNAHSARGVVVGGAGTPAIAPTSTLTLDTPLYAPVAGIHFHLAVGSDHATLTPGHHFLDAVLVAPDGSEVLLSHTDLASKALAAGGTLGFASTSATVDASPTAGDLTLGTRYQVVFRLTNDRAGTGEAVSVTLDSLDVAKPTPVLSVASPVDGTIDFGPDTGAGTIATVHLTNTGALPLHSTGVAVVGAGFVVLDDDSGPFVLYPGDSIDRRVRLLDAYKPASAALRIATADPGQPAVDLPLKYNGTAIEVPNVAPVVDPFAAVHVDEGTAVHVSTHATDANLAQVLTYSFDPGAPAGATIDPATGVVSWTPSRPGTYTITVRATDDGAPTLSDARPLTIFVADVAPTIAAGGAASLVAGTVFSRSGSFADPGSETWTGTVDYGDGSGAQSLALNADKTFALSHTYASPGTFTVTVRIDDGEGGVGTAAFGVNVAPVAAVPPPVTVTSVGVATVKVKVGKGKTFKKQDEILVHYSGAVDAGSAAVATNYVLLQAGKDKKFGTADDKPLKIKIASASYDDATHTVTLMLKGGKLPFKPAPGLRIVGAGIRDAQGRPVGQGHDTTATLGKSGSTIVASARPASALSGVGTLDGLFALDHFGSISPTKRARRHPN